MLMIPALLWVLGSEVWVSFSKIVFFIGFNLKGIHCFSLHNEKNPFTDDRHSAANGPPRQRSGEKPAKLEQRLGNSKDRKAAEILHSSHVFTSVPSLNHWFPSHQLYINTTWLHLLVILPFSHTSLHLWEIVWSQEVRLQNSGAWPLSSVWWSLIAWALMSAVTTLRADPWVALRRQATFWTSPSGGSLSIFLCVLFLD